MLMRTDLRGIYVPVVTPFSSNEELDMDSYRNYLGSCYYMKFKDGH